ncbi:hypothetical protein GCM10007063_16780 [Lentibacillus kapialis]|uniref:PPC domain-containing protein n=1 Tax=Lentibacillus kapialis TaxID=340214 RepID=A0A917PW92_9BACI|nr:PPC domain-containing DNA-binding protein [Lentibacillus kapialis]GGJ94893.1 hypothetical protein GCM10007063_16780 [Lentibacillus kapialis]
MGELLKEAKVMRQSHSFKSESFTIYGSLSQGVDLMEGILEECRKHNVTSGMVTSIGSLQKAGYVLFKSDNGRPNGYGNEITVDNPVELVNCTGFVCEDESGDLDLHLHGMVVEESGKISAGHFLKGMNPTLITVEFSISCGYDIHANRTFNENLGFRVIDFSK